MSFERSSLDLIVTNSDASKMNIFQVWFIWIEPGHKMFYVVP